MSTYKGNCLCAEIEFEHFFLCHCSRCRQTSGSVHGANLFSKSAKLKFIKGEDKIKEYHVKDIRFTTSFCEVCGSNMPKDIMGKIIKVPAGSLSSDVEIRPNAHIFFESRANWDDDLHLVKCVSDSL